VFVLGRTLITFLTLLLGLATGLRPVEVAVSPGVAAVEMRLDGRTIATLTGAPWKTQADFGLEPEPHELVAIARDAGGAELARVRQMVNMPRPPAEAVLVLLPGSGGRGRRAQLTWQSALGMPPERIAVSLDGRTLDFQTPREIALPDYVPEQVHFLRADLDFPDNLVASAEVIFGGHERDEARTELTGIPAVFTGPPPAAAQLEAAFRADGGPVRVSAVEEGPGEIVVVRDEEAREPLRGMRPRAVFDLALRPGQKVRFCWPVTRPADEVSPSYDVFMRSGDLVSISGGLHTLLTLPRAPAVSKKPRFADAISVAALSASGRNRARAVLFITGGTPDASRLAPEVVRRYLATLRVPLYVWAIDGSSAKSAERWGLVTTLHDHSTFLAAARRLLDDVAAQRIVWFEGVHLPQSLTVAPAAAGIRIAE
jgi:hypothetical protein